MNAKPVTGAVSLTTLIATACLSLTATAADDNGTLSVSEHIIRCWYGPHVEFLYGYMNSRPLGSYSPAVLAGGESVAEVYDQTDGGCKLVTGSTLSVSGFSADPGRSWLISITCNEVKLNLSAAARFFFAGDTATWEWSQQFGLQSSVGAAVACSISHL